MSQPIVVFDGFCNYCNRMVNFAISNDSKARLKFAASQSATGERLIQHYKIAGEIDSVILLEGERYYKYSSAAIRIAKYLDWPAKLIYILIIIPAFIRQPIYKWIARNRYRWFGKRDTCRLPAASEKERFL